MNKNVLIIFFSILVVPNSLWASTTPAEETSDSDGSAVGSVQQLTPVKDELADYRAKIDDAWNNRESLSRFLRSPEVIPVTISEKSVQEIWQKYLQENLEKIERFSHQNLCLKVFLELVAQGATSYKYLDKNDKEINLKKLFERQLSCDFRLKLQHTQEDHFKQKKVYDDAARTIQKGYCQVVTRGTIRKECNKPVTGDRIQKEYHRTVPRALSEKPYRSRG
ncbi:MAG: hypothetical protein GY915_06850 [bacterium]|nr:hypothetical protein [bacterium]